MEKSPPVVPLMIPEDRHHRMTHHARASHCPATQPDGLSSGKRSRLGTRDGGLEDADDSSGSLLRQQNSDSPMDDNLALLVEVFGTVFRGLWDADGTVKHTLNIARDIRLKHRP
jgi:hypothetical protein